MDAPSGTKRAEERRIVPVASLEPPDRELCDRAAEAAAAAYEPYSGFSVGAAVRTRSGRIYTGSNLENAAYAVTICAEIAAISAANSAADFDIEAIAVVGYLTDAPADGRAKDVVTPCGRCRQLILEASHVSEVDTRVISCSGDLQSCRVDRISELLPCGFGPANLGMDVAGYRRSRDRPRFRHAQAGPRKT